MSSKKLLLISLLGVSGIVLAGLSFSSITKKNQDERQADVALSPSPSTQPISLSSPDLKKTQSNVGEPNFKDDDATYEMALSKAKGASLNAESAKSVEDWQFIISLWEDAIETMKQVPHDSKTYSKAKQKISEFKKNLELANSKAKSSPTNQAMNDLVEVSDNKGVSNSEAAQSEAPVSAEAFLTDYLNYITTKGGSGSGTGYFCKETENLASSLFSPREYKILDVSDFGESASASVRINSSNRGGSPIVADWSFYMKKGESVIGYIKGGWCLSLISEK